MAVISLTVRQAATSATSSFQPVLPRNGLSALMWAEIALCLGFVALRTWVQYRDTSKFYSNDLLIVFAMACHLLTAIIYQVALPIMYRLGEENVSLALGRASSEGFTERVELYLRYHFCLLILLWVTLWAVKFSLLLFFWRIFDSIQTRARVIWWTMCALTAATFVVTLFIQLFACDSPANLYEIGGCSTKRHTYLSNLAFLFASGSDIGLDVLMLLIPFPLLWKLKATSRQKTVLAAIFLLPSIPMAFAILKLILVNPKSGPLNMIKFQLYYMVENSAAIITACIPSLRLFINRPARSASRPGPRPSGPVHYYSNSELKRIRENASATSAQKSYNPFLPKQSSYRSHIRSNTRSRSPDILPIQSPEVLTTNAISSRDAVTRPTGSATIAYPNSPHLHPQPFFDTTHTSNSFTSTTSNKLRRDNSNGSQKRGLHRMGSMRALIRGSSEQEREFGELGTTLPALRNQVMVTTEYEVESYRHSLGSTIR